MLENTTQRPKNASNRKDVQTLELTFFTGYAIPDAWYNIPGRPLSRATTYLIPGKICQVPGRP